MTLKEKYLADPQHATWQSHYVHGSYHGALILGYTREWRDANLPAGGTHDGLRYRLLDTEQNILLPEMKIYTAFEHAAVNWGVLDEDWNSVAVEALMSYWYGSHHCPCHRKQDAKQFVPGLDTECEGSRFAIHSVYVENNPDLILYSETIPEEQLEEGLQGVQTTE